MSERRRSRPSWLTRYVNDGGAEQALLAVSVSYAFLFTGAWNAGTLGLPVTPASLAFTSFATALVGTEIILRLRAARVRDSRFWIGVLLDAFAVAGIVAGLPLLVLLRLPRLVYDLVHLVTVLDRRALQAKNAMYPIVSFACLLPLVAAAVYVIEKNTPGSQIHDYLTALWVCFAFTLSLGNERPASTLSTALCGLIFFAGVTWAGVAANTLAARYLVRR